MTVTREERDVAFEAYAEPGLNTYQGITAAIEAVDAWRAVKIAELQRVSDAEISRNVARMHGFVFGTRASEQREAAE